MGRQRSKTVPWCTYCEAIVVNIPNCGMIIFLMCNMPTTKQCILLCSIHHLRHVLVTYQRILLTWSLERMNIPVDVMIGTKRRGSSSDYSQFTKQYMSSWKRVKLNTRLNMINTESTTNSRLETRCGSISSRIG